MSLTGNSTNSTSSGNRSSIFETFHTPSFGDDEFEIPTVGTNRPIKTYSKPKQELGKSSTGQDEEEEEEDEDEEQQMMDEEDMSSSDNNEPAETTLWMSCSPGRDSTDDDDDDDDDGSGDDAESSDDGLPLSKSGILLQLTGKRLPEGGKRQKSSKPPSPSKDKSSPKKPLSAYALFYRDTQSAIKSQNPQASFGEISKIVASMWDRLDSELKEDYNQRAEENKTMYLKQLAEYCAFNRNKNTTSVKQQKEKKSSKHKSKSRMFDEFGMNCANNLGNQSTKQADKDQPLCTYTKCTNPAVIDSRWNNDYCSSLCLITHCKDVFNAWVSSRQTSHGET